MYMYIVDIHMNVCTDSCYIYFIAGVCVGNANYILINIVWMQNSHWFPLLGGCITGIVFVGSKPPSKTASHLWNLPSSTWCFIINDYLGYTSK